jgi:hypothetical protein
MTFFVSQRARGYWRLVEAAMECEYLDVVAVRNKLLNSKFWSDYRKA